MILMSTLISLLFLGGAFGLGFANSTVLGLKALVLMNFFVIVRASYPRLRYDQLMQFCWKMILPITLAWFVFTVCILKLFNGCPPLGGPLTSYNVYSAYIFPNS